MSDPTTEIGRNIRRRRQARGLTLASLAGASGVSVTMLSEVERAVKNPTVKLAWQIARALDCSITDLLAEPSPEVSVVRAAERSELVDPESGVRRWGLSTELSHRGLEVQRVRVIDSHTEGEPTRVVISGGPDLGSGTAAERLERFRQHHDAFRDAVVNEPRGHRAMVGALLCEPNDERNVAQVIFFNNVGWLGMCGHGTVGVGATLAWLGRIEPGTHFFETPVGDVKIELRADGIVSVGNVASYRWGAGVAVRTRHHGTVTGDVAWGGNWFFLVSEHRERLELANLEALTALCQDIRSSLAAAGIAGAAGAEIDHIELFGPPSDAAADSRNFVLCPGGEYDRSPCGTGTSAKMACLWADGKLAPGSTWRQEGIAGGVFSGSFDLVDGKVLPTISGRAWVTSEAELVLQVGDPFRHGIRTP